MHWSTICPALVELFTKLALPGNDAAPTAPAGWKARWKERHDAAQFHSPSIKYSLYLKITSCTAIGEDERRYEMLPTDPEDEDSDEDLFETLHGNRKFTLQVQAHVLEHEDDLWAMQVLEQIRTRLSRQSSHDALLAVNVSIIEKRPSLKTTITHDKRRMSVGVLDVIFGARVVETDPSPVGWIEHINLESQLNTGDPESPLPTPPNNAPGEWIPPLPEE